MPAAWAITVVVLCVAVVALAVVMLGLVRQITPVLERAAEGAAAPDHHRMFGPAIGTTLPYFTAQGDGGEVTAEQLRGHPVVLLFLTKGCGPCKDLAEEMSRVGLDGLASNLVIVTSPGGPQELGIPAGLRILTEQDKEVSGPLSVVGTPFAIAVDPEGIVRAATVPNTMGQLQELAAALV